MKIAPKYIFTIVILSVVAICESCDIPIVIRGAWYSREKNLDTVTEFDADSMTNRGYCIAKREEYHVNYTFIFQQEYCYHCVFIIVRTPNVLEKIETGCINYPQGAAPTIDEVCSNLNRDQNLITFFSENIAPLNCRDSLEGVWQFAYQNRFRFTGECNHPDATVHSCQTPGTQFLITNQKFNITYRQCEGMSETFDGTVEYSCLGSWFVGKNHFFAVANTKESRKDEKYRCFLRNRDDDLYIAASITPECNVLKGTEYAPERLRITPVKAEVVTPGCKLPQNYSGEWINTANLDGDVVINSTHMVEKWYPDEGRWRHTEYVCRETRGSRYLMARLTVDGCQKDFICFDFVARHQNIIRFRKGLAMIKEDFSTVCSWVQFPNLDQWKYDLLLAKDPVPIRCPVAGKFNFTQRGDAPFETRILGGVTQSPRPELYCKTNISDFSVCDKDQKEITVDENYCLSIDYLGRPFDIYSDPDYKMKCIGYWKENLKSYLITYDEMDAFSRYRCWVYQRSDLTRVLMSLSVGAFCALNQDVDSWNYTEGASVAIVMEEYERERDQCPMFFDDGADPFKLDESRIQVFSVGGGSSLSFSLTLCLCSIFHVLFFRVRG